MSDLIGKTIGQYRIVEQIGLGGMATVYKAFQPSIDRYVAIKILPKQLAQDPNFVKRFQHEARAIAALEHPHILPVHDFGTSEGHTYMVMRYVEGGTLTNLMGQSIPPERIVKIVGNIARALDYAHRQGVVHRDIKPSNILIDKHGAELLTDFGIAKMIEGSGDTQLTSAGSILGTPAYMAPEQAEGKAVDGRSDIYSLGVVLYELLTGQPPYRAETPLAVVLMHLNDPLPPPRTIRSDVPEPLERVVLKAMAKDPNQRFQTAAEMDQALQQTLKEIESTSTTADISRPTPKTEQISEPLPTAPVKSGGLMVPLLIVGGVVALFLCLVGGGFITWAILANSDEQVASDTPAASGPVQANLPATPTSTESVADSTQLPAPTPTTARSENDTSLEISELDGEILFEDRFDSNQHEWFTGEETDEYGQYKVEIVDGRYRLSHQADQEVFIWEEPAESDFDDFILSVDAMPVEHSTAFAYGLIFRSGEEQALYTFEIDSDGFFFVNLLEGEDWEALVDFTEMEAINVDGPNNLTVEAVGTSLTFFINGKEAISIEDDALDRGSIGLSLELYQAGDSATIDFDNLVVRGIDASDAAEIDGNIIFAEYFDSDVNGWATGEFEDQYTLNEIVIEDGLFRLNVIAEEAAYVEQKLPNQEFSDFVLSVEATPHDVEEHYSYGVVFREDDTLHSYTFEIGNDGLYTIQLFDGEWHTLKDWSSTDAINVGETNELMVIAAGSTISFFVNGEELTQLEDDTLVAGTVGLIIDIFEDDTSATVDFDNLVIREVGTGE